MIKNNILVDIVDQQVKDQAEENIITMLCNEDPNSLDVDSGATSRNIAQLFVNSPTIFTGTICILIFKVNTSLDYSKSNHG